MYVGRAHLFQGESPLGTLGIRIDRSVPQAINSKWDPEEAVDKYPDRGRGRGISFSIGPIPSRTIDKMGAVVRISP